MRSSETLAEMTILRVLMPKHLGTPVARRSMAAISLWLVILAEGWLCSAVAATPGNEPLRTKGDSAFLPLPARVEPGAGHPNAVAQTLVQVERPSSPPSEGGEGVASAVASPANSRDWWSLRPLRRPVVPQTPGGKSLSGSPIDAFIYAKLAEKELKPSPPAERRTLIRRVYFDVIGLPSTVEEIGVYIRNPDPPACEKLVDRLLASPRYGERWARHWLDLVHYGETHGYDKDKPRLNAWPYRDYVIRAFNEDKPYDRFILEQLAGDALGEDAATGFLVAGPDDLVKSPDPVLTANQRADELHDMVSTTGSAFLGLTIGCARCHNHKFDPIPQTDYYSIKAIFEGVRHGERKMKTAEAEAKEKDLAERRKRLAALDVKLAEFEPLAQVGAVETNRLRAPVHARQNVERFVPVAAKRLRFTIQKTTDAEPCIDELEVYTAGPAPQNIALANAGTKARASSVYPNSEIHRLEHLNDGQYGNSRSWISNERGKGWVELEFPGTAAINRIAWGRDREQQFADRL